MAERVFQWDRQELEMYRRRLLTENNNLKRNQSVVETLREEIAGNWSSISGDIYLERLETDIEDLQFIIDAVGELTQIIGQVVTDAYQECEQQVQTACRRMASAVRPL